MRAALIQALVFPLMLLLVYLLARSGVRWGLAGAALLQGALAALLSHRLRLAAWWPLIQFLFPLALLGADALQLPPVLFLIAFVFLLGLYWSTFRTQVPFYPSGPAVWDAVAQVLPAERVLRVLDIGSGLGGLVLELARRRPDCAVTGIELAPLPWLLSRWRASLAGSPARFVRGDYERLNFADYDVVFAYLSPAAMPALWRKAHTELRPGSLLLSYEFAIPSHPPSRTIATTDGGPALYLWCF